MIVTLAQVQRITKAAPNTANANSVLIALGQYGARVGLDRPHRLAQFFAQLLHESAEFRYDREIWGNTPVQQRYDTRTDLGNTPERDGDGKLYMGRTAIQITGKANTAAFRDWCRKNIDPNCPDFVASPDLMNTDPWEGLGPIWYWDTRKLNDYADAGNVEMITRRVNGGLNGFDDRIDYLVRTSLVFLGYGPTETKRFQIVAGLKADGIAGPATRLALHKALVALPAVPDAAAVPAAPPVAAVSAPAATPIAKTALAMPAPAAAPKPADSWFTNFMAGLTGKTGS